MHHILRISYLALLAFPASSRSFYDNPEQDPIPRSSEELHKKWDFEVRSIQSKERKCLY